jgi:hypothetical protein
MEPYELPPEIQKLEAGRKAFQMPDLQLPSYENIGKSIDTVFTRTGDKLTPRKPTFDEQLKETARNSFNTPDTLSPIATFSAAEASGFNNPNLPYDPTVDMNELYAKYDPVTWGDVLEKTWDTAKINMWSGTLNIWNGLKEGITEGRPSALWDNTYSRELAEMTENMEKMHVMRFSEEEQDDVSTWFKQIFPSLGYVASSVVEMAAQHLALTTAGAIVGAVSGEGVGAIPGAVVGNIAAFGKDAQTLSTAITKIGQTARAINTLSTANKIKKGGQLLGYGLLSANGEAALNSQMAYNSALETQKKKYYDETGQYLSGQGLLEAEQAAKDAGSTTFALNLPLIAATNIFEFGNLVRGKAVPQIAEKLAFKINKKTGEAVMKSPYLSVLGRYAKESASEGVEEFAQGVIEDSSVNYFTQRAENRKNYLETFAESAYNRALSGEGASEFLAGAVIGGISNAYDLTSVGRVKANTKRFVDAYNTSTNEYFHALGNAVSTDEQLKEAMKNGDSEAAKEVFQKSMIQMVNTHSRIGSTQAFADTLDALTGMDNVEFKRHFNVSLNQEEQDALLTSLATEYKTAVKQRKEIDTAFQINPFEAESWFQKQINKRKSSFSLGDQKATAQQVWDVFKDTLTDNLVRYGNTTEARSKIEQEGQDLSPDFVTLTSRDIPSLITAQKESIQQRLDAKLPESMGERALLDKLNSTEDPVAQYQFLLEDAERKAPGVRAKVLEHNKHLQMEEVLFKNLQTLNSKAGQRKAIKRILDWQKYYEEKVQEQDGIVTPVEAPVEVPVEAPAEMLTVTPLEETIPNPVEAPTGETDVTDVIAPTPAIVSQQIPVSQQEAPNEDDDLADFYGEGKGEDYIPTPKKPSTEAPAEATPQSTRIEDIIDPELPEDIQVDQTALPRAIDNLEDGESIVPADSGVEVSKDGEQITKITKEKGKVKGEKKDGGSIDIDENIVPLLQVEKAPVENNPVLEFINREGLNQEKAMLLTQLEGSGYIAIECN